MISLQYQTQMLYHLAQITGTINVRFISYNGNVKKHNEYIPKCTYNSSNNLPEAAKNYADLLAKKLNIHNTVAKFKLKKHSVWVILNDFSTKTYVEPLEKSEKWRQSYVSEAHFAKNKHGSTHIVSNKSAISPAQYQFLKERCRFLHSLYTKASFNYNVQTRNFKTHRNRKADSEGTSRVNKILRSFISLFDTDMKSKISGKSKQSSLINKELPAEDKIKITAAFAEGYEAGFNRKNSFFIKLLQHILGGIILMGIWFYGMSGVFFRITSRNHEIDLQEISTTFNDIKGIEDAKQELKDVVEFLKNPEKYTLLGGKLPKGILLVGPPGTGKTLLARAVAGEAHVPFFQTAGPEFDEMLVGQGARRVRELFKMAKEKAPCVVFIDEIDSIGGKRTSSVFHPYANQTINQLLSEMDGFHQNEGIIVLGATNRVDYLDKALLRPGRFDVHVHVNRPDYMGRKEILNLYLSKVLTRNINVERLAQVTPGFTGADLENLVNQAALRAALEEANFVTMKHLEYARDKITMGPASMRTIGDQQLTRITAYHEAGHALVSYYTSSTKSVHKITIISRINSLGHTARLPKKDMYLHTQKELLAEIDTFMGGRAAEELMFGSSGITTGAVSDFRVATDLAEKMVKLYGMSKKVGFLQTYNNRVYGDNTKELIDDEVRKILQESYERALALLKSRQVELTRLAEALIKHHTIDGDRIADIINGKQFEPDGTPKQNEQEKAPNKAPRTENASTNTPILEMPRNVI